MEDRWINEEQASQLTGMSTAWFERKRWTGGGPPYAKMDGGAVRYRYSSLMAFMESKTKKSTSEYKTHQQPPNARKAKAVEF